MNLQCFEIVFAIILISSVFVFISYLVVLEIKTKSNIKTIWEHAKYSFKIIMFLIEAKMLSNNSWACVKTYVLL